MMLANFSFPTDSVLKLGVVIYYFILVLFGPSGHVHFVLFIVFDCCLFSYLLRILSYDLFLVASPL